MTKINISKKDIIWSYLAQFFNIGAGLITLPLVLNKLSADEIGMNYLMITVSTIIGLLDFGFAPQFARNITYVFAGAKELKKEGVSESTGNVDYNLVAKMIGVAKMVYSILAIVSFLLMLSGGTFYIYRATDGFSKVNNAFFIWIIFCFSIFFSIYFVYFSSLLMGKGLIKEAKIASIAQRSSYILFTYSFLFLGWGLLGVVLASLLAPFIGRIISYKYFYTKEMKGLLSSHHPSKKEKIELFKIIWYNAKKLGLVFIGSYAVNKLGMFFGGLFLSLEEIASYGLMIQLGTIISGISITYNNTLQPKFNSYRVERKDSKLINLFESSMNIFYILMFSGFTILILLGPWILKLIGSNTTLPSTIILLLYGIIVLLENNHSAFATLIVTGNKIPFVESSLIAGACICVGSFCILKFTSIGILGLVAVQGICQLVYANWKWPYVICKEFNINFLNFVYQGFKINIEKFYFLFYKHLSLKIIQN